MMELNKILSDGIWGTICTFINANFEKIRIELMKLSHASIKAFNKGYFSSETELLNRYPKPEVGWYAFVGSPWPGKVYECAVAGTWTNTNVAPVIGDEVFVQMLKYYIDNDTIYWDDANKVIKAKGGSGGNDPEKDTFTISVSIDASSVGKCTVEASGDVVNVTASTDGSVYTVVGNAYGTAKVLIVPGSGFRVQKLNVDKVSQGAVSEYTFENLSSDHTMYVWMESAPVDTTPPVYTRSDTDITYLGIYNAVKSVITDYPDGLTQDVTITCTGTDIDYKGNKWQSEGNMWNAVLKNWNQTTSYVLTLDGADKCTLDGRGFGGIYIEECSNIIIKGITFQNFNTYENAYAPEEPACIYATNVSKSKPCRNLYFENLTIRGQSTLSPTSNYRTRYGITVKNYENVCIHNVRMSQVVVVPVTVIGAKVVMVSKLMFGKSDMQFGVIGHPSIMCLSGNEIHINDCDIDASSYGEAAVRAETVDRMFVRRNHIYNAKGPLFGISNELGVDEVVLDGNYMHDNALYPTYNWDCTWMTLPDKVNLFCLKNNVLIFGSTYYQEFMMRSQESHVKRLVNVNNIFIRKNTNNHGLFLLKSMDELVSGHNIYKLKGTMFYSILDTSSIVRFPNSTDFANIQRTGYEPGSELKTDSGAILMSEQGDLRPCLLPELAATHKSISEYVSEFDIRYRTNDPANSSIGCDNYYSTEFDESGDSTMGYTGRNYVKKESFASDALYSTPSDQTLVLLDRSKNRDKFTKFIVSRHDDASKRIISLGKLAAFSISPKLDENGEYIADQLYDVTIE